MPGSVPLPVMWNNVAELGEFQLKLGQSEGPKARLDVLPMAGVLRVKGPGAVGPGLDDKEEAEQHRAVHPQTEGDGSRASRGRRRQGGSTVSRASPIAYALNAPGYNVDLTVSCDLRTLTQIFMGDLQLSRAKLSDRITLIGVPSAGGKSAARLQHGPARLRLDVGADRDSPSRAVRANVVFGQRCTLASKK